MNGRFLVVEKRGSIQAVRGNSATQFLDIRSKVNSAPDEAGMLGLALAPGWPGDPTAYVSYTAPSAQSPANLRSTLSRMQSRDGGATLDPATETILFTVEQPFDNHNGGHVVFGPDGYLYFGLGDGGSAGDPMGNAQNLGVVLGKLLRLDPATGRAPVTNPFVSTAGARPEIYAYGLRNPWRFSFDRQTAKLWVGDVGQDLYEEIDIVQAGQNYGWNAKEGLHCYKSSSCPGAYADPVVEYGHDLGISVTGGYVYRGNDVPALQGRYVYGDFGSGRIWTVAADSPGQPRELLKAANISSFGEDQRGELYVVDLSGTVEKLVATATSQAP
ncbi:MAG: PQQ-dependent sugar dehydrogenase [Deltaproteobacteria bacterium]|nr:MAG: PQQ-dependent sugar dehydrogenase [Deltaproteobacteria bacterium]TMB36253.1 MAG: PQQ-dependent sugar dehydrogenase [Deltaproteobacteria bacterium]